MSPRRRRDAPRGSDQSGQILLLALAYVLIAIGLVVVSVDASAFFLSRRALVALADGAALAGTHAEDATVLYGSGAGADVPLGSTQVRTAVAAYVDARDPAASFANLQLLDAETDGRTVTVTLSEDKPLRFLAVVSKLTGAFPGGTATITVVARARAPVTP